MSKKSRRRNKKILATIAALGGAAMLANRRRNNMINSANANDGFVDTEFKEQVVPVTSPVYALSEVNFALSEPLTPCAVPLPFIKAIAPKPAAKAPKIFLFRFLDFLDIVLSLYVNC